MLNEYYQINTLIDEIKGTTRFLSSIVSRKSGLVFIFVVLGVIISNLFAS